MYGKSSAAAEASTDIHDQHDQQNETERAAADHGAAEIKTAAPKEQQEQEDEEYEVHVPLVCPLRVKFLQDPVGLSLPFSGRSQPSPAGFLRYAALHIASILSRKSAQA